MKRVIQYDRFLDKVYGCFIGKAVSGNIGAPHEGLKMPMQLPFLQKMIDCDRPNDDLDLQVLWLDVAERKGEHFTAYDLLESFCTNCDYSPGEYAVMRKNYARGIYPPYSGKFCNDYYVEGMGCPIRSELWGCLAVGNMELAVNFASRDGQIDHYGESILAEHFMAALECEAFFEDDIHVLIARAVNILPKDSKFRKLVEDTVRLCGQYDDIQIVFTKLLFQYGHPDCTNLYQNMGITIAALLLGHGDIIKTSMMALNCGFDTDCTCATAGAVIGLLRGADDLKKAYQLDDVTYVLDVRCKRRSNRIFDLAEDIAKLAVQFTKTVNKDVCVEHAPEVNYAFEEKPDFTFEAQYENMNPSVALGGICNVTAKLMNHTAEPAVLTCNIITEGDLVCSVEQLQIRLGAGSEIVEQLQFRLPIHTDVVQDSYRIRVTAMCGERQVIDSDFGIVGAVPWKLSGPFWRTEPVSNTELILAHIDDKTPYNALIMDSAHEGNRVDKKRHFHLNFEPDLETEYIDMEALFVPLQKEWANSSYEQCLVNVAEDSFRLEEFFGFQGPCTAYLSRIIVADRDMEVFLQVGHSCPFRVYVNDELVAERSCCDHWTAENVHVDSIKLHKGENRVVLRMTRVSENAKCNVTFSEGWTCAAHVTGLKSKNPFQF